MVPAKIQNETSAEAATKPAIGASCFVAAVTTLLAILSLINHKPVFGFSGESLIDALLFVVIAWRIKKMSRTWAVLGLVTYVAEVFFNLVDSPSGAVGVLTVIFILTYIGAIRGTFAYNRYYQMRTTTPPTASLS